jgi:NAD(P)-dependent dehydrogenase (short-subunit alcohol dehydrogenase family)
MGLSDTIIIEVNNLNVSIIGENGDLAKALYNKLITDHHVVYHGKDQYNFLDKEDIITLVDHVYQSDIIINCPGVFTSDDSWDMFTINAVAPVFLLEKLVEKKSQAHVIIIGSHGAMWSSWPSISLERLSYNISKETIQSFVTGLAHSGASKLKLSVVNPTKFQSKLNGYQGYPIDIIVDSIMHVIQAPTPILIYEYNNYQDAGQ